MAEAKAQALHMATIKAVSVFQSIKEAFKLDHQIRPPRLTHPGFPIILRPLTMDDEDGWNEVRWRNNDWLAPWDGVVSDPAFVVAPINVNFGKSNLIDLALGPFPIIISNV